MKYFPIKYGKDALAVKFSFNAEKFLKDVPVTGPLYQLRVTMQKTLANAGYLGHSDYYLGLDDSGVSYALPLTL